MKKISFLMIFFLVFGAVVNLRCAGNDSSIWNDPEEIFADIASGNLTKVEKKVNSGIFDLEKIVSQANHTPFFSATTTTNVDIMYFLFKNCKRELILEPIRSSNFWISKESTPLENACIVSNSKAIKFLLENGAADEGINFRSINSFRNKFFRAFLDYSSSVDKIDFLLRNCENTEIFDFLVRVIFGQMVRIVEKEGVSSVYKTLFFKIYTDKELESKFNLERIFSTKPSGDIFGFMKEASDKNLIRFDGPRNYNNLISNLRGQRSEQCFDFQVNCCFISL